MLETTHLACLLFNIRADQAEEAIASYQKKTGCSIEEIYRRLTAGALSYDEDLIVDRQAQTFGGRRQELLEQLERLEEAVDSIPPFVRALAAFAKSCRHLGEELSAKIRMNQ